VDGLNIVRVVVPPSTAHAFGMDMIGYHVAVIGEPLLAEGADTLLGDDLPIQELPHLAVRTEFPVSPGMMLIFDAPNAHLALALFSWDYLSSAAGERTVKWAQLITAESHGFPPGWI
jgi:hypothetical protein